MKVITSLIGAAAVLAFMSAPALAADGSSGKPLSIIEFSNLPANHGKSVRMIQVKYQEYRKGRLPVTTLDVSRAR